MNLDHVEEIEKHLHAAGIKKWEILCDVGTSAPVSFEYDKLKEIGYRESLGVGVRIIHEGRIVAEDTPENLSEHLQGSKRFLVRVDSGADPQTAVAETLGRVEDVASVQVTEQGLEVTSVQNKDARPGVSAAIINKGWSLLEVRSLDLSLEEIFLQLTAEEEITITPEVESEA